MKDYYYILGVNKSASEAEIKAAYKKLSLKLHPDTNNGEKFFEDRFKDIQEAYKTLSNKHERRTYTRRLRNIEQKEDELLIKEEELTDQFEEMYREKENELIRNYQWMEEELKNSLSKTNDNAGFTLNDLWKNRKQHLAYAFLILFSTMFIFSTAIHPVHPGKTKEMAPNDTIFINLVNRWNNAHNEKDRFTLLSLFEDSVTYYGKSNSKIHCIENKFLFLQKNPQLHRNILGPIRIEKINEITYKTSFLKQTKKGPETIFYPSYLVFKKTQKNWRIITESDLITDNNKK